MEEISEAECKQICQDIWDQLPESPTDAWSVLAIVLERFITETGTRQQFLKWLNYSKQKHN